MSEAVFSIEFIDEMAVIKINEVLTLFLNGKETGDHFAQVITPQDEYIDFEMPKSLTVFEAMDQTHRWFYENFDYDSKEIELPF